MTKTVNINGVKIGGRNPLALIPADRIWGVICQGREVRCPLEAGVVVPPD